MERREMWFVAPYRKDTVVTNLTPAKNVDGDDSYHYREIADCHRAGKSERAEQIAAMIVTEHNQHAALVEQRDRLAEALREILSIVEDEGHTSSYVPQVAAARNALATVEQGGERE